MSNQRIVPITLIPLLLPWTAEMKNEQNTICTCAYPNNLLLVFGHRRTTTGLVEFYSHNYEPSFKLSIKYFIAYSTFMKSVISGVFLFICKNILLSHLNILYFSVVMGVTSNGRHEETVDTLQKKKHESVTKSKNKFHAQAKLMKHEIHFSGMQLPTEIPASIDIPEESTENMILSNRFSRKRSSLPVVHHPHIREERSVRGLVEFPIPQWQSKYNGELDERVKSKSRKLSHAKHHQGLHKKKSKRKYFKNHHRRSHKSKRIHINSFSFPPVVDWDIEDDLEKNIYNTDNINLNDNEKYSVFPKSIAYVVTEVNTVHPSYEKQIYMTEKSHFDDVLERKYSHDPSDLSSLFSDSIDFIPHPIDDLNFLPSNFEEKDSLKFSYSNVEENDVEENQRDNPLISETHLESKKMDHLSVSHQLGVRVTDVHVPRYVAEGSNASLECLYNLASFRLYSLKWYRDDMEFFRYIPSEDPDKVVLPVTGINVDVSTPKY